MKTQRIEFKPPAGVVPENTGADETFDMVSTYRVKPNGDICLIQIGDVKMPGYDDKEGGKPSYGDYAQGMMDDGDKMNPNMTLTQG